MFIVHILTVGLIVFLFGLSMFMFGRCYGEHKERRKWEFQLRKNPYR
jgi:hypothetical protein